jgi:AraC-like DNA-binding protein
MTTVSTYCGPRMAKVCPPIPGFNPERVALVPTVLSSAEQRSRTRKGDADQARALMRLWLSRDDLTLEVIAAELHVTTRHLQRIFHSQRSPGFRAELLEMRMRHAAHLLESSRPVAEISRAVGYRGPMHFSKAFRRHWGCSPRQYRQGLATESSQESPGSAVSN